VPRGVTVWLTGLSGAGKSTIAERLRAELFARERAVEILDGDEVRTQLSAGLGFTRADRDANIARIAFVANLLTRNGVVVITAAISPYADARLAARSAIGDFVEVFVDCSLDELARRDVKGLYARALRGEIPNFTGVSDPYEEPAAPDVTVDSAAQSVEESVAAIVEHLERAGYLEATVAA
jgi:adenylylsulfate kinase